ncbi:MAG: HAMP domain-containing sensor histidine kinase [Acidobacteriota bacterium]
MAAIKSALRSGGELRHHLVFGISLATLLVLGTWWAIFLRRSVNDIYRLQLDQVVLEGRLLAMELQVRGDTRLPPGSEFEVSRDSPGSPRPMQVSLAPRWSDLVVSPRAELVQHLDHRHRMKVIQVSGESSLLMILILISIFMLYHVVLVEGRVRRSMENFLSTVTHELKSPIAGMKALLQTLASRPVSDEKRRQILELGLRESARLQHLVENVLAAHRLDRKGMPIKLQPVDLRPAIERRLETRRQIFPAVRDALSLECPESVTVTADPEALGIILDNLLDNAVKYSPHDPQIQISVRADGGRAVVTVKDYGIGIEPDEIGNIFGRFYRATQSDVKAIKGTGLGLFIARNLAAAIGGELTASSEGRGHGSTFTLMLRSWTGPHDR